VAVYYVGSLGKEVIIHPDGTKQHEKLTPSERKELNILIKSDKLLAKMSSSESEYYELRMIPATVGMNFLSVWEEIIEKKLKAPQAKEHLLDLVRYHGLTYRG
jgi:hypothetical protein